MFQARTFPFALALCLTVTVVTSPARADDPVAARQHYQQGMKYYNLSEWELALAQFKQAYLDKPVPALLFNIGQCQRQLGQLENADKSYRAYLRESPALTRDQRAEVEHIMQRMEETLREQRERAAAAAAATATPAPAPAPVTPAPAQVAPAPPPPPVAKAAPRPWYKNPAGMTLAAVGVAGLATGGALFGVGSNAEDHAQHASTLSDQRHFDDRAHTFEPAGVALLAVGGAAVVVGGVVLALAAKHSREVSR